ncbi:hypothetical protein P43SY_003408 [Pythium insidiosum]|uniref:Uncharacterized protein n=1 Tax=Pythium insidiosum TaxID=114742 RepID=A0AAD5LLU4_PYTIN|nr:hypothetical protein P43SY_003408 [Pythium insidiosum]
MPDSRDLGRALGLVSSLTALTLHVSYVASYSYEAQQFYVQSFVNAEIQNAYSKALGISYQATLTKSLTICISSSLICAANLLAAVVATVRHRRLLVREPNAPSARQQLSSKLSAIKQRTMRRSGSAAHGGSSSCMACVRRIASSVLAVLKVLHERWRTYFTMDGAEYEVGTELREAVEVLTQANVLRRTTSVVADVRVTALVAGILLLNCWSTPLLRYLGRRWSEMTGRVVRLLVSMLLATVFTVSLPFYTWRRINVLSATVDIWIDPATTAELSAVTRLGLLDSWLDIVSTRVAAVTAILAIETIKNKVATLRPSSSIGRVAVGSSLSDIRPTEQKELQSPTQESDEPPAQRPFHSLRARIYDGVSIAVGILVLVFQVEALASNTLHAPIPGLSCDRLVYPWRTRLWPCSVLEINCYRAGTPGLDADLTRLLAKIYQPSLVHVRFTHCGALEMPQSIRSFRNLAHLELFNVTLRRWDDTATLVDSAQPTLGRLWLFHVANMSTLPSGLSASGFPVVDLQSCHTDLASLPSDLHTRWPSLMSRVSLESSKLGEIPRVLPKLRAFALQLAGNNLERVPDELLAGRVLTTLYISSNPRLSSLPDVDWFAEYVDIRATNVSRLPAWTQRQPDANASRNYLVAGRTDGSVRQAVIEATGTPLCRAEPSVLVLPSAIVLCATSLPTHGCSFPMDYIAARRPL